MAHIQDHLGAKEFSKLCYLLFRFIGKIYLKAAFFWF